MRWICRFAFLASALCLGTATSFAQVSLGIGELESASAHRQDVGKRLTFVCPPSHGVGARIDGTDTYTDSSPICVAALHAGVLRDGQAGIVSIVMGSGAESFTGSTRNGVTSRSYGRWGYSYTFARDNAPGTINWRTTWSQIPRGFTSPVAVACPAGGSLDGGIWGTDIYTRDSTICVAAVHAGVINTKEGGVVAVARVPAPPEYPGTERNGVASKRWGSAPDAFRVTAAPTAVLATAGSGQLLDPCPLATAVTRAFAAMRASVTSEFAALGPVAQATNGVNTTTLTAQRDGLLGDLSQFESANSQAAWDACAAGLRTTRATDPSSSTATPITQAAGNNSGLRGAPAGASPPEQPTSQGTAPESQSGSASAGTGSRQSLPRGTVVADAGGSQTLSTQRPTGLPPANFAVVAPVPAVARGTWSRTVSGSPYPTRYRLFRSAPSQNPVELPSPHSSSGQPTEFTDDGLDPRITYTYRLTVDYEDGTWGEAQATFQSPPLAHPTNFRATVIPADSVKLEWDSAPGAIAYRVEGPGLPSSGRELTNTTLTVTPIRGAASWQLAAVYPGGLVDYNNRPVASTVSQPLPSHAPAFLSRSAGVGNANVTAQHYAKLCNWVETPCENLSILLMSWGVPQETFAEEASGELVRYNNVTDLGAPRATRCIFGQPTPNDGSFFGARKFFGRGVTICYSNTGSGVSLIVNHAEGALFGMFQLNSADEFGYGAGWAQASLVPTAVLDSEGPKFVPHACLSCHGGAYDAASSLVKNASLLPIDPSLVQLVGDTTAAQEKIRSINALIRQTYSSPAIAAYIDGLYGGMDGNRHKVDQPGTRALTDYAPQGWSTQRSLYLDFVKRDCAMCHLAGPAHLNFLSAGNFMSNKNLIHTAVCNARSMPHAETSFINFWTRRAGAASGPGWFAAALGFGSC